MKQLCRLSVCSLVLLASISAAAETVSWYAAHKPERDAKYKWCVDDAGRQATDDCQNAIKAHQQAMFTGKRTEFKYTPPHAASAASSSSK